MQVTYRLEYMGVKADIGPAGPGLWCANIGWADFGSTLTDFTDSFDGCVDDVIEWASETSNGANPNHHPAAPVLYVTVSADDDEPWRSPQTYAFSCWDTHGVWVIVGASTLTASGELVGCHKYAKRLGVLLEETTKFSTPEEASDLAILLFECRIAG